MLLVTLFAPSMASEVFCEHHCFRPAALDGAAPLLISLFLRETTAPKHDSNQFRRGVGVTPLLISLGNRMSRHQICQPHSTRDVLCR